MPDVIAWLKQSGAPADVIKAAETDLMTQQAYTRARQQDVMTFTQAMQAIGQGGGGTQPSAGPKVSHAEAFLEKISGENAEPTKALLRGFASALQRDMQGDVDARVAPVQRTAEETRWERELDAYFETRMLPRFGEKAREHWPEIRAAAKEQLLSDPNARVAPMEMYHEFFPDHAAAAIVENQSKQQTTRTGGVTAGLERVHSAQPSTAAAGQTVSGVSPAAGAEAPGFSPDDASRIADEVMRDMALPR